MSAKGGIKYMNCRIAKAYYFIYIHAIARILCRMVNERHATIYEM